MVENYSAYHRQNSLETSVKGVLNSVLVRSIKKGLKRLIKERTIQELTAINNYRSDRLEEIRRTFQRREAALFRQAGIPYWPFHLELVRHGKIERQKTNTTYFFTESTSILNWTMGNEQLAGYSEN